MSASALRVSMLPEIVGVDVTVGVGMGAVPRRFGTATTLGAPEPSVTRMPRAQSRDLLDRRAGERRRDGAAASAPAQEYSMVTPLATAVPLLETGSTKPWTRRPRPPAWRGPRRRSC